MYASVCLSVCMRLCVCVQALLIGNLKFIRAHVMRLGKNIQ